MIVQLLFFLTPIATPSGLNINRFYFLFPLQEQTAPVHVSALKPTVNTEALPLCPLSQSVPQGGHERETLEERDVFSPKKIENPNEEGKTAEEEEEEAAAGGFYSNWTRGSVRRATRQLEQKMKQEAPPLNSSPPSLSGGTSCSLQRPHSALLTAVPSTPEASVCLQVSVVSSVQEEEEDDGNIGVVKQGGGDVVQMNAQEDQSKSTSNKLQPADTRLLSTSLYHRSTVSPFASVNFLCLEGVTEHESNPDWDGFPEVPYGDVVMRETWETLCELGAFLQQVRVGGAFKARRPDQDFTLDSRIGRKRGSGIQKRVSEVEARIRQAGLTPPSLMKRSASLAKLGCLELLANDFSEWELSHASVAPSSAEPAIHAVSDESKKKRVQNSPSSESQLPNVLGSGAERIAESELTSQPPQTPPSSQSPQGGQPQDFDQNSVPVPGATLKITRQQYGRTHPLRRLKKRTNSTFYHTM